MANVEVSLNERVETCFSRQEVFKDYKRVTNCDILLSLHAGMMATGSAVSGCPSSVSSRCFPGYAAMAANILYGGFYV